MNVLKARHRRFAPILRSDASIIRSIYRSLRKQGFDDYSARRMIRELIDIGYHGEYRSVEQ